MSSIENACPFEEPVRPRRCDACCAANRGVTPCVAAYLRGETKLAASNVVALRHVMSSLKAA